MNSSKQQKITWPLDNKLNLTRNKVEIDAAFREFDMKNSPMYNGSVSPLYTSTRNYDNRVVYNTNGDRFHYLDGILYMNDEPIMETDGDGYFTREETERGDYDTYDIDNDGNEVWSKYANGVISYHTKEGDFTYEAEDPLSAVIDSRARIVNGTPIIAYILAQSTGRYEFVYLKNDITYHKAAVENLLKSSLDLTTVTSSDPNQDRVKAKNEYNITEEDTKGYIKFNNALIQIANPLEDVYVVSFLSDHGGKLKPSEVGFFNILDNNGTFYEAIDWNKTDATIEAVDTLTTVAEFKSEVTHELSEMNVYTYVIPSGNAEWDALHSADAGKWFMGTTSDGVNEFLTKEIIFDPGYDPRTDPDGGWQQNVTGFYTVGSGTDIQNKEYTKWSVWKANTYTDKFVMKGTVQPVAKTNTTLDFSYEYQPVKKIIHQGELSETFNIKAADIIEMVNQALPEGKEFERFEYKTDANSTEKNAKVYGLNLQGLPAEEDEVETIDEKWRYAAANGDTTTSLTAACVMIEKAVLNLDVTRIQYVVSVLFRAKQGNTVDVNPSVFRFIWMNPDSHNQQIIDGNDFPTYKFTTTNTLTITTGEPAITLDYKDFFYYKNITSATVYGNPVYNPDGYTATIHRADYITWEDDEKQTWTAQATYGAEATEIEWTFEYTGNNTEYPAEHFFANFNNYVQIAFKTMAGTGEFEYEFTDADRTALVNYENNDTTSWSKTWEWTYTFISKQNMTPTVFLDDGTAISICDMTWAGTLPQQALLTLQARPTGINGNKFDFTTTGYYNSGNTDVPGVIWDVSIDLNTNYFRYLVAMSDKYGTTTAQGTSAVTFKWLYDSGIKTTILEPGTLTPDTTATSINQSHYYNLQGSIAKLHNKWRATINSCGLVSALTYGEDDYIGTNLTEWNSISEDFYVYFTDDLIGYHSTDGNWYEIKYHEGDGDIKLIFDRYIIINTNGFWNCYDIEKKKPIHYASDFNNRVMPGVSYAKYGGNGSYSFMLTQEHSNDISKYFVSGINSMYEVSQVAITSLQLSPQPYLDIVTGNESFIWCRQPSRYQPQYIEIFYGTAQDNTMATYQYSTIIYERTAIVMKDSALVDLNAPVAIAATVQYSPNLFTEFIHTYNNKDLIKNGTFAYPIIYNETTPILSYSSGKQIANVDNIFVIQSQFYGLINNKIVSITYDNYTIIATDAIIDVTGMVYLGYLPTMAFFWSPADRCIYTFTGDANLDISTEASKISKVLKTFYNPATESIYVATNIGVIVLAGKQQWLIEKADVDDIYFIRDGYFIITTKNEDGTYTATAYSYEKELLEGSEKQKVKLASRFVGPGAGKIATTDSIQVILITDIDEAGEITFACETFTDTGFKSEEKTLKIAKGTWDKGNKAVVCNFFPKYQTGQGFKWSIKSDFAISQVTQSMSANAGATLTQANI